MICILNVCVCVCVCVRVCVVRVRVCACMRACARANCKCFLIARAKKSLPQRTAVCEGRRVEAKKQNHTCNLCVCV